MVYNCLHGRRVANPLNSSRVSTTRLGCRRLNTATLPAVKLVINANARDKQPLRQLLYSLLSVGHYLWEDTIVVLGGGMGDSCVIFVFKTLNPMIKSGNERNVNKPTNKGQDRN